MKTQKGFTLIELMVVMAIIAILATAGLNAYTGYLRKARDATRMEDIRALDNIAISSFDGSGQASDYTNFIANVRAMNNDALLIDLLDGQRVCLKADKDTTFCGYQYFKCTDGGYALRINFESISNIPLYAQDRVNSGAGADDDTYDIGSCFGDLISEPISSNFIR